MNSRVYLRAEVLHHRLHPEHRFRYTTSYVGLDLDELPTLDRLWLFGHNRLRPVSLYDRDYLGGRGDPREELRQLPGFPQATRKIWLVTAPRYFGYVFNPVNFWFCYGEDELLGLVAEVNNTFGERHAYVLPGPGPYASPKAFFVSPFNAVEGDYEVRAADPRERLDIRLRVRREGRLVFNSWVRGEGLPFTAGSLVRSFWPSPWLTVPRIHREAATLYFRKGLPLVEKPVPTAPLRAVPPSLAHRLAMRLVLKFLERTRQGALELRLPDGTSRHYGQGPPVVLQVKNYDLFPRLVVDGDVGLGDAFVAGELDSPDMVALLRFFLANREGLDDRRLAATRWVGRVRHRLRHLLDRVRGDARNVRAHYDLGNEHFASFLDPTMTYSCALFQRDDDDLERAQRNKLALVLEKAEVAPGQRVLEIGCGWGALALAAARQGAQVTGLTLSHRQLEEGQRRVASAGLEDRVRLLLQDYREHQGSYDRIVSVEMLEAVGHAGYPSFFAALERLLAPGGVVVLQVITVPDFSYDQYRRSCDWIQKEIFPGTLCPSLAALLGAAARHSQLVLQHAENLAPHYARTLALWRRNFLSQDRGEGEHFRRRWSYYFSYCEAGFASRNLGLHQLVLKRPQT